MLLLKCVCGWERARECGREVELETGGEPTGEKAPMLRGADEMLDGEVGFEGARMRPGVRPNALGLAEND